MGILQDGVFCKVPFRVSALFRLAAEQTVSEQQEQNNKKNGKQRATQKEGKEHSDGNPD